ncbi:MAG: hypothetical protein L0H79_21775, partial [Intrasporangium sp.]|uniref:hypothetical protein n=1 Tax=Intrasporangium sp. TaxID=1925024 RepID=UPI0026474C7E
MRAARIPEFGRPPVVGAEERPSARSGTSVIATTAVPITPLDVLCATGSSYFGPRTLPYVPGVQG